MRVECLSKHCGMLDTWWTQVLWCGSCEQFARRNSMKTLTGGGFTLASAAANFLRVSFTTIAIGFMLLSSAASNASEISVQRIRINFVQEQRNPVLKFIQELNSDE